MNYLDHLYQPIQEDTLNEISADFIAKHMNNYEHKMRTKFTSAMNALKSRNKAFKGVPNYKINRNSPAWTMPTKHYQASMGVHDKMTDKLHKFGNKAEQYLAKKNNGEKLPYSKGFSQLYDARERDKQNRFY